MTVPLRISTPARFDLIAMTEYLVSRDIRVAVKFRRAVKVSLDRLRKSPDLGELWPTADDRLQGLRVWPIRGFQNHLIFHRFINGEVVVLRVFHASQDTAAIFAREEGPESG
jgi:plasmid stabilization system protein ParE